MFIFLERSYPVISINFEIYINQLQSHEVLPSLFNRPKFLKQISRNFKNRGYLLLLKLSANQFS